MNMNTALVGLVLMLICQDIVAIKAFKKSTREGMLCAALPGYLLIYGTRKDAGQAKPLIGWLVGLALFVGGALY